MIILQTLTLLVFVGRFDIAGSLEARVNCGDHPTVYVDGQLRKGNLDGLNWSGDVADSTKVLAIECRNSRDFGGLLVSVENILISDNTWRCSRTRVDNWYSEEFDDSSWVGAYVIGNNERGVKQIDLTIPKFAKWIWADEQNSRPGTIFCRGRSGAILHARCNDKCDIYADGNHVGSTRTFGEIWSSTTPRESQLIAVAAENSLGTHGVILVGVSTGFKTSQDWMCLEGYAVPDGWMDADFDDRNWTSAQLQTLPIGRAVVVDDVFNDAMPIWIREQPNSLGWVRCRGRMNINDCATINNSPKACEQICIDLHGSYECQCHSGFVLDDNGLHCSDIDECLSGTHNCSRPHQCVNTVGSYTCESKEHCSPHNVTCEQGCSKSIHGDTCWCYEGFIQNSPDNSTCLDIDECFLGLHGCSDQFQCYNTPGGYQCLCPTGYTQIGRYCSNIDECSLQNDCSQGCTDVPGSYVCWCFDGYTGQSHRNKTCVDVDECTIGQHNCTGLFQCKNTQGGFECECSPGYVLLSHDEQDCVDVDECETSNGGCSDLCNNTVGSFFCSCLDGRAFHDDGIVCAEERNFLYSSAPIIGALIGLAAVFLVCLFLVVWLLLRRRSVASRRRKPPHSHHEINDTRTTIASDEHRKLEESEEPIYQEIGDILEEIEETLAFKSPDWVPLTTRKYTKETTKPYEDLQVEDNDYVNAHVAPYEELQIGQSNT